MVLEGKDKLCENISNSGRIPEISIPALWASVKDSKDSISKVLQAITILEGKC